MLACFFISRMSGAIFTKFGRAPTMLKIFSGLAMWTPGVSISFEVLSSRVQILPCDCRSPNVRLLHSSTREIMAISETSGV